MKENDIEEKIETNAKLLFLENYPAKSPKECIKQAIKDLNVDTYIADILRMYDLTIDEYIEPVVKRFFKIKEKKEWKLCLDKWKEQFG